MMQKQWKLNFICARYWDVRHVNTLSELKKKKLKECDKKKQRICHLREVQIPAVFNYQRQANDKPVVLVSRPRVCDLAANGETAGAEYLFSPPPPKSYY